MTVEQPPKGDCVPGLEKQQRFALRQILRDYLFALRPKTTSPKTTTTYVVRVPSGLGPDDLFHSTLPDGSTCEVRAHLEHTHTHV